MKKTGKILSWMLVGFISLMVVIVGYRAITSDSTNARVAAEIRENPEGERASKTMLLTLADGRMYPVNFLHEGGQVFMGIDGRWWREFVDQSQPVSMFILGEKYEGTAIAILDDQAYVDEVFARLRPTAPAWLPDWLNAKLVVITLTESSVTTQQPETVNQVDQ